MGEWALPASVRDHPSLHSSGLHGTSLPGLTELVTTKWFSCLKYHMATLKPVLFHWVHLKSQADQGPGQASQTRSATAKGFIVLPVMSSGQNSGQRL